MAQVASSWLVIWKQPSPSIAQTVASGQADLGAHRGRHRVAHRAGAAGVEPGVRVLVLDELRGPHLVLADAGDVDRVRTGDLAQPLDHVLRGQRAVGRLVVARAGTSRASGRAARHQPVRSARWPASYSACDRARRARSMTSRQSPTIGTSAARFLPISAGSMSACTISASRREAVQLAGHPVVEPGAERDQQVGLLQRGDRGDRAVHAGHAEVLRVAVRERAARHQRGDDRDAGELGQLAQLRRSRAP